MSEQPIDVDALLKSMLDNLGDIDATRQALIEKLKDSIFKIEISNDDSGAKMEAKMGLIKGFSDLLKDRENTAVTKVKVAMNKKANETQAQNAADLVEVLRNTSLKTRSIHVPGTREIEVGLGKVEKESEFTPEELSEII